LSKILALPSELKLDNDFELDNDFKFADHFSVRESSTSSPFIVPDVLSSSSKSSNVRIEGEGTVRKWLACLNLSQYTDVIEANVEMIEDVKALG